MKVAGLLAAVLLLAGCVSAAGLLKRAEDAWAAGRYDDAVP